MGDDTNSRHSLFAAACDRAEWSVRQAWLAYFALGGQCDIFDVEGFLEGLVTLRAHEQDVLAVALNERLHDLYLARCVPYLQTGTSDPVPAASAVEALADLVPHDPPERAAG
jgi:hypothetical protein